MPQYLQLEYFQLKYRSSSSARIICLRTHHSRIHIHSNGLIIYQLRYQAQMMVANHQTMGTLYLYQMCELTILYFIEDQCETLKGGLPVKDNRFRFSRKRIRDVKIRNQPLRIWIRKDQIQYQMGTEKLLSVEECLKRSSTSISAYVTQGCPPHQDLWSPGFKKCI